MICLGSMDLKCYQWIIYAQRDGVCEETGKKIRAGDIVSYLPPVKRGKRFICGGRVFHQTSKEFKRSWKACDTGWKISGDDQTKLEEILWKKKEIF